jgi:undecaprenyl diphosphate synthase
MGSLIYWMYERLLIGQLNTLPRQICFFITAGDMRDAPGKLLECTNWCREISELVQKKAVEGASSEILGITYHISTTEPSDLEPCLPQIRKLSSVARLILHIGDIEEIRGDGIPVTVAIGKSGRDEIIGCIRRMAADGITPEQVDENRIEPYLTFPYTPDLVIKTGGNHLTDFLIWQSVYSELFFLDVNWKTLRKVDFLRALRDYQSRVRRFGK